jgi:hypothetical protein
LTDAHSRNVIGGDSLTEFERLGAMQFNFAHVAHIEKPRVTAHCQVLLNDALILDRHFPAGKLHHLCRRSAMRRIERSSF